MRSFAEEEYSVDITRHAFVLTHDLQSENAQGLCPMHRVTWVVENGVDVPLCGDAGTTEPTLLTFAEIAQQFCEWFHCQHDC